MASARAVRLRTALILAVALGSVATPRPAGAVPIPFANCGKSGDQLSIQKLDATYWPAVGHPTILAGTATVDPLTGTVTKLRVTLLLGTEWVFESQGNLALPVVSGFVVLPATLPMNLVSPALPLPAGPYSTTKTFTNVTPPMTIASVANLATTLTAVTSSLGLSFNGIPGFPIPPANGAYSATIQVLLPSGAGVFCFRLNLTDTPFIELEPPAPAVPALSDWMLAGLATLLAVAGLLALWPRAGR